MGENHDDGAPDGDEGNVEMREAPEAEAPEAEAPEAEAPEAAAAESDLERMLNALIGPDYLGKFSEGDNLDRLLLRIQEEIILPAADVLGFNRAEEFTRHYTPFGKANTDMGIVKTPEHIARLICDIARVGPTSQVLDITCGTGTFLVAAHDAMMAEAETEEQRENMGRQLFGIDKDERMWGTTLNQLTIRGATQSHILNADIFDNYDRVQQTLEANDFQPNVTIFNPPHATVNDLQPHRPLEFLRRACDFTADGGIVVALMPLNSLVMKRGGRDVIEADRTQLLQHNRLVATMQLPDHIFSLLPSKKDTPASVPVIVVMEAGTPHNFKENEVWMSMWLRDGFRHKDKTGLVEDEKMVHEGFTWESIRAQWRQSYLNQRIIPLNDTPKKGNEPPYGASHQRKIRIQNDDWIAVAEIPPPKNQKENFLDEVGQIWADYVGYLRTMRRK